MYWKIFGSDYFIFHICPGKIGTLPAPSREKRWQTLRQLVLSSYAFISDLQIWTISAFTHFRHSPVVTHLKCNYMPVTLFFVKMSIAVHLKSGVRSLLSIILKHILLLISILMYNFIQLLSEDNFCMNLIYFKFVEA